GAVIHRSDQALAQVLRMVTEGSVLAVDGTVVPIKAQTICIHGDGQQALAFAQDIRNLLEAKGVAVAAMKH
ncbi:lactam utilization protein LamB, partial [Escherichia coli]|nr:lactam utilization protein LamB [Escherichia coli]